MALASKLPGNLPSSAQTTPLRASTPGSFQTCTNSAELMEEPRWSPFFGSGKGLSGREGRGRDSASPRTLGLPPPPWPAGARQGWYQRSARHRPNRKFHLSGRPAPGPQMGNGAVPFAKTKRGAAAPGALGARSHRPAPGHSGRLPGPRRRTPSARPSPTSGRELYLSPARRSLEPPPSLRARLLFMVPVAGRESQRRGPRGRLAPIAVGARGTRRARGARGRTGARGAQAAPGRGGAGGAGRAEFRSQPGVPAAGGRSRPHSSCPGQVVSGCGLPGARPAARPPRPLSLPRSAAPSPAPAPRRAPRGLLPSGKEKQQATARKVRDK